MFKPTFITYRKYFPALFFTAKHPTILTWVNEIIIRHVNMPNLSRLYAVCFTHALASYYGVMCPKSTKLSVIFLRSNSLSSLFYPPQIVRS